MSVSCTVSELSQDISERFNDVKGIKRKKTMHKCDGQADKQTDIFVIVCSAF